MGQTAFIVVDHGSRRAEANDQLLQFVELLRAGQPDRIIEPAHMELAEPSVDRAFEQCVARGAGRVVVVLYFLSPGRHWDEDIPKLVEKAAATQGGVPYRITAPIGLHPLMPQLIQSLIDEATESWEPG